MQVTILNTSHSRPLSFIGRVAGISHGKDDESVKRALGCWRAGHGSVLEHVSVTFKAEGISRACSHQLVRHRMASYVQESQRYTRIDTERDDWYVMPPSFDTDYEESGYDHRKTFEGAMRFCAQEYKLMLDCGMRLEDARYLLPEACKTSVNVTMNLRELESFYKLRADRHAQWEIRDLANKLMSQLRFQGGEWCKVCDMIYSGEVHAADAC